VGVGRSGPPSSTNLVVRSATIGNLRPGAVHSRRGVPPGAVALGVGVPHWVRTPEGSDLSVQRQGSSAGRATARPVRSRRAGTW
jgi:hypothetical protein